MKYYVPVGRGGVFFRFGMTVVGMMSSLAYWRASRRRAAASRVMFGMSSPQSRTILGHRQTCSGTGARSRGETVARVAGTER
jgi:hypothetical protein